MTRTLADMTPAEWQKCVGRWAEVRRRLVIIAEIDERSGDVYVFRVETSNGEWHHLPDLTPRMDLPRAWTPTGEPVTEDTPEPNQPRPEDVKPEPSPTRPVTLTTESELLLAPLGTIIRGPETWDFYPYTKWTADEWVGANESKRFTDKAEHMAGKEWTVLYMPGVGS